MYIFPIYTHIQPIQKQTLVIQRLTTYNLCTYEKYIYRNIECLQVVTHTNEHAHARKNHTIFFPQF